VTCETDSHSPQILGRHGCGGAVRQKIAPVRSWKQEFGEFATWTQANAFATRLNAGLEIDPSEAGE